MMAMLITHSTNNDGGYTEVHLILCFENRETGRGRGKEDRKSAEQNVNPGDKIRGDFFFLLFL